MNNRGRALTVGRLSGAVVAALCLLVTVSTTQAQSTSGAIEEIIVTGSRIPRPDFNSASPIVTVDAEAFKRTISTSVETVLNRLPQFVPDFGETSNNPGQGGQATVQLRGLGAFSTLVLLDGRRLIPAHGNGAVDVNIIPPSLVERVEVITGGASAAYGSDAVAGVVNFRLKQDFDDVVVEAGWGRTDQGDGEEKSLALTAGTSFAEDRGHVYVDLSRTDRDGVTEAERKFSEYALGYYGPGAGGVGPDSAFLPVGSNAIAEGRTTGLGASSGAFEQLFARYGYGADELPPVRNVAANADGSLFTIGCADCDPGSVLNYRGERDPHLFNDHWYTYNYAPWNYLRLPMERTTAFGRISFELRSGAELFAQVLYADYTADRALAPTPSNNNPLYLPSTNPYIPADLRFLMDSRADPDADLRILKRFVELGPRIASNNYQVYQATVGVSGQVFGNWNYEAYLQRGDNDQREEQQALVSRSRVFDLTYAPDGGLAKCGEFNLFKIGGIAPKCAEYISTSGANRSGYKQSIFELSTNGPVWTLPAGEVELALGVMHKSDEFFYDTDPIASVFLDDVDGRPDVIGFNASDDIRGLDNNWDAFAELRVPLLADRPLARDLELQLGYRRSEYDSAGGADSWKAELLYQPVGVLRLRGSRQGAVRAPSIFELYLPRLQAVYTPGFNFEDPCAFYSDQRAGPDAARVESLCLAQGVPPELLADFDPGDDSVGLSGGNPELEPESANTVAVGFVLSPAFENPLFAQIQLGVDWYRIEIDDAISGVRLPDNVATCFDPTVNTGMSASNYWCSFFTRAGDTGTIQDFVDTQVNYGLLEVSGIDVELSWQLPLGPGALSLNALAAWLDSFSFESAHGLPKEDGAGVVGAGVGGSQPEWKDNINLAYQWREFTLGAQWRYVDAMHDVDRSLNYRIGSHEYWDVYAEGAFETGVLEGIELRIGVENLSDEEPPLLPNQVQANTDPSQYDVLGRRYYLNMSYRL